MSHYKKFVGKKCYLSPCSMDDAEHWTRWFNDLAVTLPLGDEAYTPFSLEKSQEIVSNMIKNQEHVFSIIELENNVLIGRCLLFSINWVDRHAMLGIVLGEKAYWDKGHGQEATKLLLDYAFNLLNLNSIMLGTFSFNKRALKCYQNVGFKEIGRRREARIIGSQKVDAILLDMLAAEFNARYVSQCLPSEQNREKLILPFCIETP